MAGSNGKGKTHPVSRQHRTSKKETTLNRVVRLILETFVMDHWNQRVAVRFDDQDKKERIYLDGDTNQGHKVVLAAPPEPIDKRREHLIWFRTARKGILKRVGESDSQAEREAWEKKHKRTPSWRDPMREPITPKTVEYRTEHWPTEFLQLHQGVYTTQQEFDQKKAEDRGEGDDLWISRVLIQWDPSKGRVVACLIDGEEFEVEEESSGLVHEHTSTESHHARISGPLANP